MVTLSYLVVTAVLPTPGARGRVCIGSVPIATVRRRRLPEPSERQTVCDWNFWNWAHPLLGKYLSAVEDSRKKTVRRQHKPIIFHATTEKALVIYVTWQNPAI